MQGRIDCRVLVFLFVVGSLGCGQTKPSFVDELVPVTGTVTFDGQPLADATVIFISLQGESRQTSAVTDGDGKYSLMSANGFEGAVPGDYDVLISKFVTEDGSVPPQDVAPMDVGAMEMIPERYSNAAKITLKETVSQVGGTIDFALSSKRK